MTLQTLLSLVHAYNIPPTAALLSDSGWECDATPMNGLFYNPSQNTLVFTQGSLEESLDYDAPSPPRSFRYSKQNGWVRLTLPLTLPEDPEESN